MPVDTNLLDVGTVVDKRWKVTKVLGSGSFGAVYEVMDLKSGKCEAMKVELTAQDFRTLKMEVVVLKELTDISARNCCKLVGMGKKETYSYIVMTLVGASLQSLLDSLTANKSPDGKNCFTLRSSIHLAVLCLQGLEDLHFIGYLHRDIKPQNYAVGRDPDFRKVFVLDFGMCRKYLRDDGSHKRPRSEVGFRGTLYYASHTALKGEEQSRRDDVWSWLYTIIQVTMGSVPWKDVRLTRNMSFEERKQAFADRKCRMLNSADDELLRGLPQEFKVIQEHLKQLTYYDCPNYGLIYQALMGVFRRKEFTDSMPLDWEPQGEYHQMTMMAPAHNMMPGGPGTD
uniref:Protein kinase domain-containing protein n=1 Tax=Trichuris muris TaxID=70415 RepID=A0A5S6QY21_TRIMR